MVSRLATVALGTPIPLLGTALCVDFNGCLCRLWTALSGFQWIDCSQCFLHRLPSAPMQCADDVVIHVRVGRNLADVKLRINLLESQLRLQYRDRGKHP
ncbi:tRNA (uracil-O(2)-)-methyltransferase [Trichinella pseudospiralis]